MKTVSPSRTFNFLLDFVEANVPIRSLSPTPVMLHIIFDQDWPNGFRDIQVWKCGQGRTTTDGPLVYYKLTLWAFGSGELKRETYFNKLCIFTSQSCKKWEKHQILQYYFLFPGCISLFKTWKQYFGWVTFYKGLTCLTANNFKSI